MWDTCHQSSKGQRKAFCNNVPLRVSDTAGSHSSSPQGTGDYFDPKNKGVSGPVSRGTFFSYIPRPVILRTDPAFLPKISSSFHHTQEIVLPTFCSAPANPGEEAFHTLDVIRCLVQYLALTKDFRKSSALFIIFPGSHKGEKASKSTLGKWFKWAIKEAYVALGKESPLGIAPHFTRSVVTSWAERASPSPEQICKAATWSSTSVSTTGWTYCWLQTRPLVRRYCRHPRVSFSVIFSRCCPERGLGKTLVRLYQ